MKETIVRAKDLMRTEVATLSTDDTIDSAVSLFEDLGISGAPVLAGDRLVGVLSLSDIARSGHLEEGRVETGRDWDLSEAVGEEDTDELDPAEIFFAKEDYSPDVLGRELVSDWMTERVVTVKPDAPLEEVCALMVRRSIHRVFVVEADKLLGVLSSFDVVRHVAGAKRKQKARSRSAAR